jgi:hypothetical protein
MRLGEAWQSSLIVSLEMSRPKVSRRSHGGALRQQLAAIPDIGVHIGIA